MFKAVILGASAVALTAAPVAVSAATTASAPAAKLSLAGARAAAPTGKSSRLAGPNAGPIAAGIILVGIAVGAAFLIDDQESSDSN